ncbi:MAG: hypothetical protein RJB13_722 [Pseudomonadota bacterium]|jgi:hypothetical protein
MGKLLIWFSILYGNLVALVGLAGFAVWWTKQASGQQFCDELSLTLTGCRSVLLVADVLVMGYATYRSFGRLSIARRRMESKENRSEKEL